MSGFVVVCRTESPNDEKIELPTEEDGSLLLSVLQSQFEGASGLKYRNPTTGSWRAIKLTEGVLKPPSPMGWTDMIYYAVISSSNSKETNSSTDADPPANTEYNSMSVGYSDEGAKRMKLDGKSSSSSSNAQPTQASPYAYGYGDPTEQYANPLPVSNDLIVLGLEWKVTTEDLRKYFEKFGEITSAEVKTKPDGSSRGFGFIRFKDTDMNYRVCELNHSIKGRRVEVKMPHTQHQPTKLFVGCLPLKPPVEREELESHFAEFGQISDLYIPNDPYRGFGFVTFKDPLVAQRVISMQHTLRKSQLNVSYADPKGGKSQRHSSPFNPPNYSGYQQHYGQYPPFGQPSYPGHPPQANPGAYAYYNYGNGQQQGQNNYNQARSYHTQGPANQSMVTSTPSGQSNSPYTQPHYPPQQFPSHRPPSTVGPQGAAPPPVANQPPVSQATGSYDMRGIWSNY